VDLDAGLWSIRAERMKMNRAHTVPLSPEALSVFQQAATYRAPESDLIFPGRN
jgi:integrase